MAVSAARIDYMILESEKKLESHLKTKEESIELRRE